MIGRDLDGFINDVMRIGVDHLLGNLDYAEIQDEMTQYEKTMLELKPNSDGDMVVLKNLDVDLEMLAFMTLHDSGLFPTYLMLLLTSNALKKKILDLGMEEKDAAVLARSFVTCFYYISAEKYKEVCKDSEHSYINRFVTILGSCGLFSTTYNAKLTEEVVKMFGRSLEKGELSNEEN